MTVKVKWATTWTTIPSGKLRVKWGTLGLAAAGRVKVRWTTSAGAPYWVESGYIGLPATPPEPSIAGHEYGVHPYGIGNTMTVNIRKPTASAQPIAQYDVQRINTVTGGVVTDRVDNSVNTYKFESMDWHARYKILTRSIGATGLVSPWSAEQRIDYGSPNTVGQKKVIKTRDWTKTANLDVYRGQKEGLIAPVDVVVTHLIFDIRGTFPSNVLSDPGSSREVSVIIQGNEGDPRNWANPQKITLDIKNAPGEGKLFGLVPRGDGWTTFNEGTANRVVGTMTAKGQESYADWVDYTIPGEKFGYW